MIPAWLGRGGLEEIEALQRDPNHKGADQDHKGLITAQRQVSGLDVPPIDEGILVELGELPNKVRKVLDIVPSPSDKDLPLVVLAFGTKQTGLVLVTRGPVFCHKF